MEALKQVPLQTKPELTIVETKKKSAFFYIKQIRAQLGRSSVAFGYDSLTVQQKAIVLYGAKLKPAQFIHTKFESFTLEQREEVRKSLIAIRDLSVAFGNRSLSRVDVMPVKEIAIKQPLQQKPSVGINELNSLNSLVTEISN